MQIDEKIPLHDPNDIGGLRQEQNTADHPELIRRRGEVQASSTVTKFVKVAADIIEEEACKNAIKWQASGQLKAKTEDVRAEIAFTLGLKQRHMKNHPCGETVDSRLKVLQWVLDYLS